jgi:hypothetical protein
MSEEPKKRTRKAKPKYEVICEHTDHLDSIGCQLSWLDKLNEKYGFERFEYIHKFRAFRCYLDGQHVDWVDVNDLALINGHRRLENILLRHMQVDVKRAVIKYPWR